MITRASSHSRPLKPTIALAVLIVGLGASTLTATAPRGSQVGAVSEADVRRVLLSDDWRPKLKQLTRERTHEIVTIMVASPDISLRRTLMQDLYVFYLTGDSDRTSSDKYSLAMELSRASWPAGSEELLFWSRTWVGRLLGRERAMEVCLEGLKSKSLPQQRFALVGLAGLQDADDFKHIERYLHPYNPTLTEDLLESMMLWLRDSKDMSARGRLEDFVLTPEMVDRLVCYAKNGATARVVDLSLRTLHTRNKKLAEDLATTGKRSSLPQVQQGSKTAWKTWYWNVRG